MMRRWCPALLRPRAGTMSPVLNNSTDYSFFFIAGQTAFVSSGATGTKLNAGKGRTLSPPPAGRKKLRATPIAVKKPIAADERNLKKDPQSLKLAAKAALEKLKQARLAKEVSIRASNVRGAPTSAVKKRVGRPGASMSATPREKLQAKKKVRPVDTRAEQLVQPETLTAFGSPTFTEGGNLSSPMSAQRQAGCHENVASSSGSAPPKEEKESMPIISQKLNFGLKSSRKRLEMDPLIPLPVVADSTTQLPPRGYKRPPHVLYKYDGRISGRANIVNRDFEIKTVLDVVAERQRKQKKLEKRRFFNEHLNKIDLDIEIPKEPLQDGENYPETVRNALVESDWKVIGIDEVAVGSHAGPVVMTAVSVPLRVTQLFANEEDELLDGQFKEAEKRRAEAEIQYYGGAKKERKLQMKKKEKFTSSGGNKEDEHTEQKDDDPAAVVDQEFLASNGMSVLPRLLTIAEATAVGVLPPPLKGKEYNTEVMVMQISPNSQWMEYGGSGGGNIDENEQEDGGDLKEKESEKKKKKAGPARKPPAPIVFPPTGVNIRDSKQLSEQGLGKAYAAIQRYINRGLIDVATVEVPVEDLAPGTAKALAAAQVASSGAVEQKFVDQEWRRLMAKDATQRRAKDDGGISISNEDEHGEQLLKVGEYTLPDTQSALFDEEFEKKKFRELAILPKTFVLMDGAELTRVLFDRYCPANLQVFGQIQASRWEWTRPPPPDHPHMLMTNVRPIPKGDTVSLSIAIASIIAKAEQANIMQRLHEKYPQYQLASNLGYGTAAHIEAIQKYGLVPGLHRANILYGNLSGGHGRPAPLDPGAPVAARTAVDEGVKASTKPVIDLSRSPHETSASEGVHSGSTNLEYKSLEELMEEMRRAERESSDMDPSELVRHPPPLPTPRRNNSQ